MELDSGNGGTVCKIHSLLRDGAEGTYFSPFSSAGVEVVALNIPDFCQFWLNFIGTTLRHLGGTSTPASSGISGQNFLRAAPLEGKSITVAPPFVSLNHFTQLRKFPGHLCFDPPWVLLVRDAFVMFHHPPHTRINFPLMIIITTQAWRSLRRRLTR